MNTELITRPVATSENLIAVLVPMGEDPSLGEDAPAKEIWEADFKDEANTRILLRGSDGARWLLVRLPESDDIGLEDVREAGREGGSCSRCARRISRTPGPLHTVSTVSNR